MFGQIVDVLLLVQKEEVPLERLEDSKETNVEVEDTEADPDEVAIFSTSVNDPSAGFISRICDGGGEHVDVTDSSYKYV